MDLNSPNLKQLFEGFKITFNKGFSGAQSHVSTVTMRVPSSTAAENYAWLAALPRIREWVGERIIHQLSAEKFTIRNKDFEQTVSVKRNQIEDDQYGIFAPIFEKMGRDAAMFPDELAFHLLAKGFTELCFDGQNFFDVDHPIGNQSNVQSVSNFQVGTDTPWFLLDCSQPLRPLIYQERKPFDFTSQTDPANPVVFMNNEYIYGSFGRYNVGFGLWQLAYASKAELNAENYEKARSAMQSFKSDNGTPLGISPTHLVVPPALEGAGRRLLKAVLADGGTNEWSGSAELIVTPYLNFV